MENVFLDYHNIMCFRHKNATMLRTTVSHPDDTLWWFDYSLQRRHMGILAYQITSNFTVQQLVPLTTKKISQTHIAVPLLWKFTGNPYFFFAQRANNMKVYHCHDVMLLLPVRSKTKKNISVSAIMEVDSASRVLFTFTNHTSAMPMQNTSWKRSAVWVNIQLPMETENG